MTFDRYLTRPSAVHRLDPRVKVVLTLAFILSAALLPDGAWVAYLADQDTDEVLELYLVPADGSAAPVKVNGPLVTEGDVQWFQFSPDGDTLVVSAVIPFSFLFAATLMLYTGVSGNLMSLGALDFGLIVDGAVIVVEGMMFALHQRYAGQRITAENMNDETIRGAGGIMKSAVFGQVIILIVYVPIFALIGVEGKMFRPMAFTVSFAIIGALILSLTYVPWAVSIFMGKKIPKGESWSERMIHRLQNWYAPKLRGLLHHRRIAIGGALVLMVAAFFVFGRLGGEFIPELDEGDFATNVTIRQGSNLSQSIEVSDQLARILLKDFPEVKEVVGKIGSSEIPTDPMPIESQDLIIVMKDRKDWKTTKDREQMAELMNEKLSVIPGMNLSFEQPIQMRFNELIAGVKSDIALKIYGDDLDELFKSANAAAALIATVPGATDIKVEQVTGMPQLVVKYDRARIAQYGLNIADLNRVPGIGDATLNQLRPLVAVQ